MKKLTLGIGGETMKYIKKLTIMVITLGMMLSSLGISSASELNHEKEADILYQLGLFSGTSEGEYQPNLEGVTNREQAMIMLARVLNWEVVMDVESSFSDVSDWAVPYVEYAKEKEITAGIGGDLFGASNEVTKAQLLSWITSALGYGNAYNNPQVAVSAGLITKVEASELLSEVMEGEEIPLIRDDLVGVFYKALTVKNKTTNQLVVEDLIEQGVVDKEQAENYGLLSEVVDEQEKTEDNEEEVEYIDGNAYLTVTTTTDTSIGLHDIHTATLSLYMGETMDATTINRFSFEVEDIGVKSTNQSNSSVIQLELDFEDLKEVLADTSNMEYQDVDELIEALEKELLGTDVEQKSAIYDLSGNSVQHIRANIIKVTVE